MSSADGNQSIQPSIKCLFHKLEDPNSDPQDPCRHGDVHQQSQNGGTEVGRPWGDWWPANVADLGGFRLMTDDLNKMESNWWRRWMSSSGRHMCMCTFVHTCTYMHTQQYRHNHIGLSQRCVPLIPVIRKAEMGCWGSKVRGQGGRVKLPGQLAKPCLKT